MNSNLARIAANVERGYGEHIRTWTIHPAPELRAKHSRKKKKSVSPKEQAKEDVCAFRSDEESLAAYCLLNPNLFFTKHVFSHLPILDLRSCAVVCSSFLPLARDEIQRRNNTAFIVGRKMPVLDARVFIGAALFDMWVEKPNDPYLLMIIKNPDMHPPGYMGEAKDTLYSLLPNSNSDAPKPANGEGFSFPKRFLEHVPVLGVNIFTFNGKDEPMKRDRTFAIYYVPAIRGLIIRKLILTVFDHAIRVAHFASLRHSMDDLTGDDATTCQPRGFFLVTNCSALGVPCPEVLDTPFCSVRCVLQERVDVAYVFAGKPIKCASIWLDREMHKGNMDDIRREFKKIRPDKLTKDAVDIFALFFTTGRLTTPAGLPLTEKSCIQEEVEVFKSFFSTAKLIGCSIPAGGAIFGNTACSVWQTADVEDRKVKSMQYSRHPHTPRKSIFFIVAASK
ncbi:uncharacterized protein LOC129580879 [Paramacrobiotus metropolitanus]|uniref:uncharacterized protein LOC129580879 n=1 Tax=Paramacrobiotus metropolitanus TaxID=2943436 RepID=UPI002445C356|nr:uncharacterized protein LOC129580879 [Paramacrobiotus metropolitanus]